MMLVYELSVLMVTADYTGKDENVKFCKISKIGQKYSAEDHMRRRGGGLVYHDMSHEGACQFRGYVIRVITKNRRNPQDDSYTCFSINYTFYIVIF